MPRHCTSCTCFLSGNTNEGIVTPRPDLPLRCGTCGELLPPTTAAAHVCRLNPISMAAGAK